MPIEYPVRLGLRGSSNGRVIRGLKSGRIGYSVAFSHYFHCRVRFGRGEFTPAAATSQVLSLNDWSAHGFSPFPLPVRRMSGAYAYVEEGIAGTGITGANIEIGRSGDTDALLTASSALPAAEGLVPNTPLAAEDAARTVTDYEPTLRVILSGGGSPQMTAITGGIVWVFIRYEPVPVPVRG